MVDNASTDGSDASIAERFPRVAADPQPGATSGSRPTTWPCATSTASTTSVSSTTTPSSSPAGSRPLVGGARGRRAASAPRARRSCSPPRSSTCEIDSPTFVPGAADGATLGVRVSGVEVDGVDRWRDAQFGRGLLRPRARAAPEARSAGPRRGRSCGSRSPPSAAAAAAPRRCAWRPSGGRAPSRSTLRSRRAEPRGRRRATTRLGRHRRSTARPFDVINNAGSISSTAATAATGASSSPTAGQYDEPAEVFAWCGGSVLLRPALPRRRRAVRRALLPLLRGHRPLLAGPSRGWRYRYVPDAVVRHVHAASSVRGLGDRSSTTSSATGCSCWPRTRRPASPPAPRGATCWSTAVLRPAGHGRPVAARGADRTLEHGPAARWVVRWRSSACSRRCSSTGGASAARQVVRRRPDLIRRLSRVPALKVAVYDQLLDDGRWGEKFGGRHRRRSSPAEHDVELLAPRAVSTRLARRAAATRPRPASASTGHRGRPARSPRAERELRPVRQRARS